MTEFINPAASANPSGPAGDRPVRPSRRAKRSGLSTSVKVVSALGAGAALALAAPLAASAHVSVSPSSTAAGSSSILTFSVGHGCEGSPTTKLTIDIPEDILSVTPVINPGWDIEKVTVDLEVPATDSHGEAVTQRTGQVVYTAKTPLSEGFRDSVAMQVTLPEGEAGDTLVFPALQTCEVGETDWANLPEAGSTEEPEDPAPIVTLTAAEAEGDGHGGGHGGTAETVSDDHGDEDAAAATSTSTDDVLARVLGLSGLVVGVVGVVIAIVATRRRPESR
ncbi:YcnI family protein [Compostimonas suwonensis]|uniref:Uncharacterized protein YcnI n=1 Tax=Compostimonas suwonensis TaxID=1048394 RepID=A0A2M9C4V7_9MICO|nr:YcnI family protein [Compostimonas suwonensis]PJJ65529.1 uncharacterized protein YcnI [Compostimonas suwonensis]